MIKCKTLKGIIPFEVTSGGNESTSFKQLFIKLNGGKLMKMYFASDEMVTVREKDYGTWKVKNKI